MMLTENTRVVLGLAATAIAVCSYIPYFRDIFRRKTKPHAFSWLIWGLLMLIGFAGQLSDHAGPGAWVIGFSAAACLSIFVLSLRFGEKEITKGDWWCLACAIGALPLWIATSTPLWSMIVITIIDILGFIPTFRKSYHRPNQETVSVYALGTVKHAFGIAALETFSVVTALYPLSLLLANAGLTALIISRRKKAAPAALPVSQAA